MRVNSYDREASVPDVGSRWIWERGSEHAEETVTVTAVQWNGEEWWVAVAADDRPQRTFPLEPGKPYWNDLSRFWEAVTPAAS